MVPWEALMEWAVLVAPEEDNDQIRYRNKKAAGTSNEAPAVNVLYGLASLVQAVHDPLLFKLYVEIPAFFEQILKRILLHDLTPFRLSYTDTLECRVIYQMFCVPHLMVPV